MNAYSLIWLFAGVFVGFCLGFTLAAVLAQAKIDELVNMESVEGERT